MTAWTVRGTAAVIGAFAVSAAPAQASLSFTFSFSGGGDSASGTLTTNALSGGSYAVTGITGMFDGIAITGLAAPGSLLFGNDNLLFPAPAYLDLKGLGFTLATGPDELFYSPEGGVFFDYNNVNGGGDFGSFRATQVPEPETASLLVTAIAGLGLLCRRRRQG